MVGSEGRVAVSRGFPARFWKRPSPVAANEPPSALPAFAEVVPHDMVNRDYWGVPSQQSPLRAVLEKDWKYIRRMGEVDEELFHLSEDANEHETRPCSLIRRENAEADASRAWNA